MPEVNLGDVLPLGRWAPPVHGGGFVLLGAIPSVGDGRFPVPPASGEQAVFATGDVEIKGGARVDSIGLLSTGGGRGKGHVVAGGSIRLSGKARVARDARCGPGGGWLGAKGLTKTHERVVIGTLGTPIGQARGEYVVVVDALRAGDASMS